MRDEVNETLQSSRRLPLATVTDSWAWPAPTDIDGRRQNLRDGRSEVARASELGQNVLEERPAPGRVAVPHSSVGWANGRRGEPTQGENVTRAKRQAHDAIAGEALVGSARQARAGFDLGDQLPRVSFRMHGQGS